MTISRHVEALNDRLTKVERVAEVAPERTFQVARQVAAAIGEASNAMRQALMDAGLVALNDDRLREVEATMFGYLMKGNPELGNEIAVAEGFADALDGPAGERVMAQMVRDRDFIDRMVGDRDPLDGARETEAEAGEGEATQEATLLMQARYVLRNLNVERPGAGYGKMAEACERAADRARAAEPEDAPAPRM